MKKVLIFVSGLIMFVLLSLSISHEAYADVAGTDSVMNGLITQQAINQTQKPQFSDRNDSSEAIDPVTGSLSWKQNNIHLPGREGLDLDIGVLYQNNYGFSYMRKYNAVGSIQKYNYLISRYDLGAGWSFRFPSVQWADGYMYYHTGEGSVYRVDFDNSGPAFERETHLRGYQGKDLHFMTDSPSSFSNGQDNSVYYVEYASKKREYFTFDGRLLGIVDRYGNKITFTYQDRKMYDNQTYKVISSITDTIGRTVTFTYDTNLQTATDANFNGENIVVSVKDPSGNAVQSVTYTKWRSATTFNGTPDGYTPYLWKIQNQVGNAVAFSYAADTGKFDYRQKEPDSHSGYNSYFLLSSVNYPASKTFYQYDKVTRNLGISGGGEEFRVTSRYDQTWRYDTTQAIWSLTGDNNHVNYTYSDDYSGYPSYFDSNNLPSAYTYSSRASLQSTTGANNLQTISTFNGMGQPISTESRSSNGERKVTTNLIFNSDYDYLPVRISLADYAVGDTDSTANKLFINKQYTALGSLQSETQPLTQAQLNDSATLTKYTTTYAYEPTYNQLQSKSWYQNISDASPMTENYAYDSNGRVITSTNAKGEVTNTCYDVSNANGIVASSCTGAATPLVGKVQKITSTKNLNNGKTQKVITIFGAETSYSYPSETDTYFTTMDASGQPLNQTVKSMMTYDIGSGLLKGKSDGNNNQTTYTYDGLGRTTEVKYPTFKNLNGEQYDVADEYGYSYYSLSNSDSVNKNIETLGVHTYRQYTQKSNGQVTYLNNQYDYYDGFGNLRASDSINPASGAWQSLQYHYDDLARANYAIDYMQNTTTQSYDSWGRPNEVSDVYGNLYVTEYNLKARRTVHYYVAAADVSSYRANPNQANLKSSYIEQDSDQWGNVLTNRAYKDQNQTQPITESYTYNTMGQVVTYLDPNKNANNEGVTKKYTYDALNRLVTVKDALNQLTNYQYDVTGNIQQVSMQNGPTDAPVMLTTKQYNEVGGLTQKTDPSSASEIYTYNNLGLLNKQIDRNGTVLTNQYDEQNRNIVSAASANGTTLTSMSIIGSNGIMYDAQETYLNGAKTSSMQTRMDSLKRITWITNSSINYASSVGLVYDGNNRVTQLANYQSGFSVNYHYDRQRMDRVQTDGMSTSNAAATANAFYDYFASGQVKSITYPVLTDGTVLQTSFVYDTLNRLKSETNKKGTNTLSSYSYDYDDNGNIKAKTETANNVTSSSSYTYDKLNRLLTISRSDGSQASYTYDLRGNRQTVQDSAMNLSTSDASYKYDLLNRLTNVTSGTGTTSFAYSPDNMRYKKTTGTQTIQYQYNASGQVISESDGTNAIKADYIRGDRLLAKKEVSTSKMYYYLYNGHGDVVQIVDTSGNVVNQYQYDEWGTITSQTEGISNSFKYAGEQYDGETGLYYLRARYYDPSMGRFINEDTYEGQIDNPLSLNLYTYVENNPLIYTDPSGRCVAGKDAGCYVDSNSGVDKLINNPQLANNSTLWWGYQRAIESCNSSACVAKQKAAQKKLEKANDEIRNSACTYVNCFDGEAKFIGIDNGMPIISQETKNGVVKYTLTSVGVVQCNCFTAGTKVQTDKGEKPIEDIHLGDKVLSKNEETGELAYKEVTATFKHSTNEIYKIQAGNQTIEATFNHPFWVKDKGWTVVKDLKVGDLLVQSNGNALAINDIIVVDGDFTVYNMTVDDFHTYFVSDLNIWVHNTSGCFPQDPNNFNPVGLIRRDFAGTKNGQIIKWFDPVTNKPIYEWNEDLKFGNHYHYTPSGNLRSPHPITGDTHIWPGDPLLEEEEEEE